MASYSKRLYPDKATGIDAVIQFEFTGVGGDALMQGRLKVTGSPALAGKFQSMFKSGSEL